MRQPTNPNRWDLVTPDQLGGLLDGVAKPDLWYLTELVECAGKVLARCGDGDLYFVGRSPDSLADFLGGALAHTDWCNRLVRLPLSLWTDPSKLTAAQRDQFRSNLTHLGLTPDRLNRRKVTFVDLVSEGMTYENLFALLREWVDDSGVAWKTVRTKLRFIGITRRQKTSPNTWRWYQDDTWRDVLPRRALVGVSLDPYVWAYFGDAQHKLTASFRAERWLDDPAPRRRDVRTREALAEAVAIVEYGRSVEGRRALASVIAGETAMREQWLRGLAWQLKHG